MSEIPTFHVPSPIAGKVQPCNEHGRLDERIKNVEKLGPRVQKVELALAAIQGKWAVLAVLGMAAVSAIFKYALP